jgi:hypothetical protein
MKNYYYKIVNKTFFQISNNWKILVLFSEYSDITFSVPEIQHLISIDYVLNNIQIKSIQQYKDNL